MTTDQFIAKMNSKIEAIIKEDKPLMIAVRDIMALQSLRIFRKGLNSSEAAIGQYKKKPIYVPLLDSPKSFTPKGKPGAPKKKDRKTGYFTSWLAYKEVIGRNKNVKTVDLFFRGDLHRNWANGEITDQAKAIKINQHNYITRLSILNQNKVERYGKVFNLSVKERSIFLVRIQQELAKALK